MIKTVEFSKENLKEEVSKMKYGLHITNKDGWIIATIYKVAVGIERIFICECDSHKMFAYKQNWLEDFIDNVILALKDSWQIRDCKLIQVCDRQ